MKHLIFASALMLSTPLAAQDRMTQTQCSASVEALVELTSLTMVAPPVQADDEGWCLLRDIEFQLDPRTTARMGTLRWRAADLDRFIEEGLPPRTLEVEGRGLGVVPETGDAVFDYLLGIQMSQMQMGFGASVRWDGVQNAVLVDTAYFNFDRVNGIEATARIDGVNLTNLATMQTSLGSAGLRNLTIKSQFDGWFESFAVMMLGEALLDRDGSAPRTQVAALKRQASEIISEFPDQFMPANSRTALENFVTALPTPRGSAQVQISADPTLGMARTAMLATLPSTPTAAQVIETGLDGVTVLFTWTPTGDAE